MYDFFGESNIACLVAVFTPKVIIDSATILKRSVVEESSEKIANLHHGQAIENTNISVQQPLELIECLCQQQCGYKHPAATIFSLGCASLVF